MRFENPPLSFNPKVLFIEQQENGWQYKIYADGTEIGLLLYRNDYEAIPNDNIVFTDEDKDFLINATSINFKKNPKEASNIFHSIIKASVSKAATEKKEKPKPKSKDKPNDGATVVGGG
ncbi:hypothetical protein [Mucilaginibacter sp.]|uniref:hypothetical protein n=1 Tax=Mucilaginibacter sp. TaxID=1882438 RepID=UPI00260F4A2A|nr:hypothetical protein [Mucilaginibacter sp.]